MTARSGGGSRFLYEPFDCARTDCAPGRQIEAYERVMVERWAGLEFRLKTMEELLARLERRLWMTVVGVSGVVLTEAAASLLSLH